MYYLFGLYVTPGNSVNMSHTIATTKFMDINGDGLPDHICHAGNSSKAYVKLNKMGQVGLLKTIVNPHGARTELKYGSTGNTVDMPQHRYVLSEVTRYTGIGEDGKPAIETGPESFTVEYTYEGGYYDREERMFYGFSRVTQKRAGDTAYRETYYENKEYYKKGMVREVLVWKSSGNLAQQTMYAIDDQYPRVTGEQGFQYDDDGNCIETRKYYGYDGYGNLTLLNDEGDISTDTDN